MRKVRSLLTTAVAVLVVQARPALPQEAKARWEMRNQIRRDKFDIVLPQAMRENKIDMWITVMKEGNFDPLHLELGPGYVDGIGFLIFTDRGAERIERAALSVNGYEIRQSGAYDIFGSSSQLKEFVKERDPKRIGVNISDELGFADGLSHAQYETLIKTLGAPWSGRLVSAEKLISDFLFKRVSSEIAVFSEAGQLSRELAERALSNEVIIPGRTTLEEISWWIQDRLNERDLQSSFFLPNLYITGPDGIEPSAPSRIIQRGDLVMIDWGVGLMGTYIDMKRIAYVLKPGETRVPTGIQNAFDEARKAREIVVKSLRSGKTGAETLASLNADLEKAGFAVMKEFNKPEKTDKTQIICCAHPVANWGHGIGPSLAFFQVKQQSFVLLPQMFMSVELFAYTPNPDWGGKLTRIPLEDDAVVTANGVEWIYPRNDKIILVR